MGSTASTNEGKECQQHDQIWKVFQPSPEIGYALSKMWRAVQKCLSPSAGDGVVTKLRAKHPARRKEIRANHPADTEAINLSKSQFFNTILRLPTVPRILRVDYTSMRISPEPLGRLLSFLARC